MGWAIAIKAEVSISELTIAQRRTGIGSLSLSLSLPMTSSTTTSRPVAKTTATLTRTRAEARKKARGAKRDQTAAARVRRTVGAAMAAQKAMTLAEDKAATAERNAGFLVTVAERMDKSARVGALVHRAVNLFAAAGFRERERAAASAAAEQAASATRVADASREVADLVAQQEELAKLAVARKRSRTLRRTRKTLTTTLPRPRPARRRERPGRTASR